jgi:hypothetical protein
MYRPETKIERKVKMLFSMPSTCKQRHKINWRMWLNHGVQVPTPFHIVQTGSGTHPASYPTGTGALSYGRNG